MMKTAPLVLIAALLIAGCSKSKPDAATLSPSATPPADGPSEKELHKILSAQYEKIRNAGGAAATMTATGQSLSLYPTLHGLQKDKCEPIPQIDPNLYECTVTVSLTLKKGDNKPGTQGERIQVRWDPKGEWVPQ